MDFVGWLLFLIVLLASIGLHEVGHMVPAKKFGVKVSQYMIGFGPTMWSKKVGDTEYGIKWILLGGYIRMVGMISPTPSRGLRGASEGFSVNPQEPKTWWGRIAADAREASAEDIAEENTDRVFYKLSAPRKLIVMMGGPTMNLVLAIVFLGITFCVLPSSQQTNTVEQVSECLEVSTDGKCPADSKAPPAMAAGMRPGDKILAYGGVEATSNEQLRQAIADHGTKPATMVVERAGEKISLDVAPTLAKAADGSERTFIGVSFAVEEKVKPVSELPSIVWTYFSGTAGAIIKIPQMTYRAAESLFTGAPRDPSGAIGIVGIGRLAGDAVSMDSPGVKTSSKVAFFLSLMGSLNMALFVFNLIPLLPLDGGHAAGAIWEGLRRQIARMRKLPDPGPVDIAKAMPIAYGVFALLAVMAIVIIAADIFNPISLTG